MSLPTFESEVLSLGNIHPDLNRQFAQAIEKAAEVFHDDSGRYDARRKAKISISISLEHDVETNSTTVETGMSLSLPGFKRTRNAVRAPHGATHMVVDVEADQLDLVRDAANVHSLPNQE